MIPKGASTSIFSPPIRIDYIRIALLQKMSIPLNGEITPIPTATRD
jgi:hypothetical protein